MRVLWWVCVVMCSGVVLGAPPGYTSHAGLVERMARAEGVHMSTFSIGKSVQNRDLRAALCAANGTAHTKSILLVGNIHGDETLGREAAARVIESLAADPIDADVVVVPSANPDGYEACRRRNANRRDLNRCFPDRCDLDHARDELGRTVMGRGADPAVDEVDDPRGLTRAPADDPCTHDNAPEVSALMALHDAWAFDSMVVLHGGAFSVYLPWDNKCGDSSPAVVNWREDGGVAMAAANVFVGALADKTGLAGNGTANGSEWYQVDHGFGDFGASRGTNPSITIELSTVKTPLAQDVPKLCDNVVPALRALLVHLAK